MSRAPQAAPAHQRFLSDADCRDIVRRIARYARGGGETAVTIVSRWAGNVRWARNRVTTSGENRDNYVQVKRTIQGASSSNIVHLNDVGSAALVAATRRAERVLTGLSAERVDADVVSRPGSPLFPRDEPTAAPKLFFESTYQLDDGPRADVARQLMASATAAGMLSAGYLEVSATSLAYLTSWGYSKYCEYTWAQCGLTVRDPTGVGSGWAGVDWPEWNKVHGTALAAAALDKCLSSRHPVALEPGRYTTILEPQAVCDFIGKLMFDNGGEDSNNLDRRMIENSGGSGFSKVPGHIPFDPYASFGGPVAHPGVSRLGERVIDERLSISTDPMDPELGFPPFRNSFLEWDEADSPAFHPALWIERGVLKNLAYDRTYAIRVLGRATGLSNPGAFRMSVTGPTTSNEEMIATTKRGVLVTRFDDVMGPYSGALVCRGYTRDGLWLIENGKISKPIKNFLFVESIMATLNNVEQVGVPQRVFHPLPGGAFFWRYANPEPAIVPPLKIKDFSFTALSDAI